MPTTIRSELDQIVNRYENFIYTPTWDNSPLYYSDAFALFPNEVGHVTAAGLQADGDN